MGPGLIYPGICQCLTLQFTCFQQAALEWSSYKRLSPQAKTSFSTAVSVVVASNTAGITLNKVWQIISPTLLKSFDFIHSSAS